MVKDGEDFKGAPFSIFVECRPIYKHSMGRENSYGRLESQT